MCELILFKDKRGVRTPDDQIDSILLALKSKSVYFNEILSTQNKDLRELVLKMLVLDPKKRWTVT